jgi:hypothetical protein
MCAHIPINTAVGPLQSKPNTTLSGRYPNPSEPYAHRLYVLWALGGLLRERINYICVYIYIYIYLYNSRMGPLKILLGTL